MMELPVATAIRFDVVPVESDAPCVVTALEPPLPSKSALVDVMSRCAVEANALHDEGDDVAAAN
eukprot:CAMPEP_0197403474 /NCGR_PEP_ID=MMETSP1165-20131217/21584_1 /TAXON_ID=284809 /ORGANISM="Chrysocystis fragilis, Strain CCMP3189" /LENGTH=63 /DNA_ID=CAMNT_0042929685 /DNA_START=30 /DNA_END=218 /DNA_ORIENTATION=+